MFPLVPALRSTHSAIGSPTLFAGFIATIAESDFSRPFIIGYGSSPSRCGPVHAATGQTGDLPVPVQGACMRARVVGHAESIGCSQYRTRSCCLPHCQQRRHSGQINYRGSVAGPHVPLSTLRRMPHDIPRMTRGQRDLLDLRCWRLPLLTPCRSPGALTDLFCATTRHAVPTPRPC
ncbi:hypothetical protein D3C72_1216640 [compost metagenome]